MSEWKTMRFISTAKIFNAKLQQWDILFNRWLFSARIIISSSSTNVYTNV